MNLSDTYVIRNSDNEISDYVFIDPTRKDYYRVPDRHGYETAVSFSVTGKPDMNYPLSSMISPPPAASNWKRSPMERSLRPSSAASLPG